MTTFIADISSYQAGLTIGQLRDAGFSAVILKATEGTGWTDPQFPHWLADARTLDFPVAAYHFVHPGSGDAQAAHVRAVVSADVPVWMDCEAGATRADGYAVAAGVRQRGGLVAGIYFGAQPAPGYGWWRAAYLSNPTGTMASAYAANGGDRGSPWVGEDLWQFGSRVQAAGQKIDASAFRGTVAELLAHGWFQHRSIDPISIVQGDDDMRLHRTSSGDIYQVGDTAHLFATAGDAAGQADAAAWSTWTGWPIVPINPQVLARIPVSTGTVDVAALSAALAGPLSVAVAADLPASPAGTLTRDDVAAALRTVLHNA